MDKVKLIEDVRMNFKEIMDAFTPYTSQIISNEKRDYNVITLLTTASHFYCLSQELYYHSLDADNDLVKKDIEIKSIYDNLNEDDLYHLNRKLTEFIKDYVEDDVFEELFGEYNKTLINKNYKSKFRKKEFLQPFEEFSDILEFYSRLVVEITGKKDFVFQLNKRKLNNRLTPDLIQFILNKKGFKGLLPLFSGPTDPCTEESYDFFELLKKNIEELPVDDIDLTKIIREVLSGKEIRDILPSETQPDLGYIILTNRVDPDNLSEYFNKIDLSQSFVYFAVYPKEEDEKEENKE